MPPREEWEAAELLDRYLDSLKTGTTPARNELLRRQPALRKLFDCLEDVDSLADCIEPRDYPATRPERLLGSQPSISTTSQTDAVRTWEFGRYELLQEVGRGGMGIVYKARQKDLDRTVALKMIRSSQFASDQEIRRFYTESKATARLMHPNIIAIHEAGEVHGQPYFAMDFVDGLSLEQVLQAGPMDVQPAVRCLVQVAGAVDHLHSQNVIHRDLKPANILLNEQGHPYVTDFGLAKVFQLDENHTRSGTILGTPGYMSPEQASGRPTDISALSDVYSLGAILYAMLTGRPVFKEDNPLETLLKVLESEPLSPSRLNPQVPRELELICLRCLEKDPRKRYGSAAELADDLERFLRQEPVLADQSDCWQRLRRWVRREPALVSRLIALLAASCVVQLNYLFSGADWQYHRRIMLIFTAWMTVSAVFQKLLNRRSSSLLTLFAWAMADAGMLTAVLCTAQEPLGPLLVGYPMLIVASGLFFRIRLVWFMTLVCLISYAVLMQVRTQEALPAHYPIVFGTVLSVLGIIVAYQVYRMQLLSRYFESHRLR